MRHRAALLSVPLALLAVAGCSAEADPDSGEAVPAGVVEQYSVLADEVAERGGSVQQGDWTVNYIVEAAEPWFEEHGSEHLSYREPQAGETHHIEVIPTETATGRIIPDVPISLEVVDADGKVVQEQDLNFYYSTFFHYANNFSVPEAGTYTLRATLGAPTFNRHGDEADGPALEEGATVEFADVELAAE
jgi:hypothetical protein